MVKSISDLKYYKYSTHQLYGFGIIQDWMKRVTLPNWYLELGDSDLKRQEHYLVLFKEYIESTEEKFLEKLRVKRGLTPVTRLSI